MRRTLKILLPVLLVLAMLLTSVFVFVGISGAAASEATMKTQTITLNTTADYIQKIGTATTANDTFATLAATLATSAPTENTRYTITLNQNVTIDTPISIVTNEFTEVLIDLNGYTLTTATEGDAITVSGNGIAVRINGNYNADGKRGRIVYAQSSGSIIKVAEGATTRVFVRNIEADLSPIPAGGVAMAALGGTLTAQNLALTYAPSVARDITFISAEGALVEMKMCELVGNTNDTATSTAVSANAAQVFALDTTIDTKAGIVTSGECDIMTVNTDITAAQPITLASNASTAYILGGRLEATGGAIISGTFDKANTVLYYGTGNTVVVGDDPANYTTESNCSFAKNGAGEWVMSHGSTSETVAYNLIMGSAPTVSTGTYETNRAKLNTNKYTQTTTVVNIVTLLSDAESTKFGDTSANNEWYNRIIDLNGHTLTDNGSGNYDTYGNPYIHYDGADVNGKVGKLIQNGTAPMYIRTRVKAGYLGANEFTVYRFENIDLVATKTDAPKSGDSNPEGNPFFCIQQGEAHLKNVNYVYDGTLSTSAQDRRVIVMNAGSSSANLGKALVFVDNTSFSDTSTNQYMITTAFAPTTNSRSWFSNVTTSGVDYAISSSAASATTKVYNSTISAIKTPYTGSGVIELHDVVTLTGESGLFSSDISPVLYYGTGKTSVKVPDGADLAGNYSTEDGYAMIMKEKGVYVLMDADNIVEPSVTMPAVFANKMVLQRNKPLNIYGFCETEGAVIEVTLAGRTATATVKDGEWCATFEPFDAMFGQTLEVRQIGNTAYNLKRFTDVNIGEVWVMAGQSNANLQTQNLEDVKEYYTLAETLGTIRAFKSGSSPVIEPRTIGSGTWYTMNNAMVQSSTISAIGYVTVVKLAAELGPDVPVGVMHLTRGSLKIKTMIDIDTLRTVSPSAANEHDFWLEHGKEANNQSGTTGLPSGAHGGYAIGSVMYNQFIAPLENFKVAGVMWYQGEGDSGGGYYSSTKTSEKYTDANGVSHTVSFRVDENGQSYAEDQDNSYTEFFYALQQSLRKAFGNDEELPFYVMQLSPFLSGSYQTENIYKIKMEMYEMCKDRPNTHLVSLATDGTVIEDAFFGVLDADMNDTSTEAQGFIHPLRKSTIGIRTADMILANEYGIQHKDVYTYPTPLSAVFKDGKVTVTFDSTLRYFYGDSALGFEVYNGSAWVRLSGRIEGNTVVLDASELTSATKLRYGCGETLIELGDGTIIEVTVSTYVTHPTKAEKEAASTAGTTIPDDGYYIEVTYNGTTYKIYKNSTDMIRTMDYGNITNLSGVPMPLFGMEITQG